MKFSAQRKTNYCYIGKRRSYVFPKGFTLIEVLIGTFVAIFMAIGILYVLNVGDKIWNWDMGLVDLQQIARGTMHGIVSEIRQSKPQDITITDSGTTVAFAIPDSTAPIRYTLSSGEIIREHPQGTERILANDISQLQFCCLHGATCDAACSAAHVLEIRLAVAKNVIGKNLSFSLVERVRLRND